MLIAVRVLLEVCCCSSSEPNQPIGLGLGKRQTLVACQSEHLHELELASLASMHARSHAGDFDELSIASNLSDKRAGNARQVATGGLINLVTSLITPLGL